MNKSRAISRAMFWVCAPAFSIFGERFTQVRRARLAFAERFAWLRSTSDGRLFSCEKAFL